MEDIDNRPIVEKIISDATSKDIESYICLEMDDIKSILGGDGLTSTISSTGRGDNAHHMSLQSLIEQYKNCKNIRAILIVFTINEAFPIMEIKEAIDELYKIFIGDEDILFSVLINNTLSVDEVQVNSIIKH